MKRILFVLALMLVLTVCFIGEAFALRYPFGDIRNDPTGDDHPWGGDEVIVDPPPTPPIGRFGDNDTFSSGNITIDYIFKYFILNELYIIEEKASAVQTKSLSRYESLKYESQKSKGIRK